MKDLFYNYLGMGDQLARPLALGLGEAFTDLGIPAAPFLGLGPEDGRRVDEVIGYVTRTVTPRPVSWDLTGYRPNGLVDGHPEFLGYYQGRTEVPADA